MSEISNILKELQSVEDDSVIDVFVPSVNRLVKFKPLSVKQHHEILKCGIDGVLGSIKLSTIFNKIIIDNSLESIDFTVYDTEWILLKLRMANVGESVTIKEQTYNLNDLVRSKKIFDYTDEISYKDIIVQLAVPNIKRDIEISEACHKDFSKGNLEDRLVSETISSMLSYEVIKFIKTVTVNDLTVNFDSITTADKRKILDNLPLSINNMITNFITKYRDHEQISYTFEDGTALAIDGDFLTRA
jgi:hypothetical protein